ncbi:MAG TPA: ornithine carbamoyltransferase [Polyangiaceae bacterium]
MPHLLTLSDLGPSGLNALLDAADRFKAARDDRSRLPLAGKSIALVFEKASTRTRLSLEIAVVELGGHPIVLTTQGSQMGRGEPIADTARVLSRMVHAITFRTSGEQRLLEMVAHSTVPVLNALTDEGHPMQLLADLMTVRRAKGRLTGLKYAWVGDGNNMAASWIEAAGLLGFELTLACPPGYEPSAQVLAVARTRGGKVQVVADAAAAVEGADVVSTDVFASMGQEQEQQQRLLAFAGLRLTRELLSLAHPEHVVLHCLPAHRGEEIDADVLEGPNSRVWDEAEARLHTSKAAILWAMGAA